MLYRRPIGSLLLALKKRRLEAFRSAVMAFDQVQQQTLLQALRQVRGSAMAMAHGLRSDTRLSPGDAIATLRGAFPVCDYEHLRPWIERFRNGDARALFGSEPGITREQCKFVSTSGTTGAPKIIPVTPGSFRAEVAGWQAWGLELFSAHRDAAFFDVLPVSAGVGGSSMSGLATWDMQPASFKTLYAAPARAQAIEPFDLKLKALLRLTVHNRNLGMIMAANPSTLLMMMQILDTHSNDLVRDLYNGTFFGGSLPQAGVLGRLLTRRDRVAARRLDAIIAKHGRLTPTSIWPQLKVVATWMGGTLAPYGEALRPTLGHVPWRDYGLVASEGRFTVPVTDNTPDGVLDPRVAWYEFMAPDHESSRAPQTIAARDLIPGESYRLVVTTLGGLYRYDMHDIVQCRGFYGEAPVLRFLRKSSHFSNITGEKLCAAQVSEALTRLSRDFGGITGAARLMTLVADYSGSAPHYALHVECPASTNDLPGFAAALDSELAKLNSEYDSKRKSGRLGPLGFHCLPAGYLELMRNRHLKQSPGATAEQYKPPVLMDDIRWKTLAG